MSKKLSFFFIVGILISSFFSYFFFKDIQFSKLSIKHLNYNYLILALSLSVLSLLFRAKKFCISVSNYNSSKFEVNSILIGSFFNLILPFRIGEIIRALYLGNKRNESRVFYFSAIIVERFFDIFFLCILSFFFLIFFNFDNKIINFNLNSFYILTIIFFILLIFFFLFLTNNKFFLKNLDFVIKVFNKDINLKIRSIVWILNLSFNEILKMKFLKYFLFSLLQWTSSFSSIYFLCLSLDINLDLISLVFLVLITYLSLMIPSGPGFVGSYQLPILFYFISNKYDADIAYQYAMISWIFLVLFFALIGSIITFFEKHVIFKSKDKNQVIFNKWIPTVKKSSNYEKILNNFFLGNKDINYFNKLILNQKMTIEKDLGGGSGSYTILSKKNNFKFVRKWSPPQSAEKLELQYNFIINQKSDVLPKTLSSNKSNNPNTFYYDMYYYDNYKNGFDFLHNNSEIISKKLITNVSTYILNFGKVKGKIVEDNLNNYINQKLFYNIKSLSLRNKTIADFIKYKFFFLNGRKYLNYEGLKQTLRKKKFLVLDDLSKSLSNVCHGDTTIDNLLVKNEREFKIVDPNYNFINSPLIDFAKLKQSLNSGYEFLMNVNQFNLNKDSLNFNFNKSERYQSLNDHLDVILAKNFNDFKRPILLHEAIHFARLLLYKDNLDHNKTIIYFCMMLKILNEYVEKI